ncbi:MAG: hypothetical protein DMG70_07495 [Acidobacteria bacterium]|nr:MAG: hypothetical protein DMG70_07495 [Acidobacteriota bacterium]PYY05989.1 MAG: hypothetical protein DMG69_24815 [Acidobacteriota bacterium]
MYFADLASGKVRIHWAANAFLHERAGASKGKMSFPFHGYDINDTSGGVAGEWVTQLLRQGNAKVFKKYSQLKLQMKREALFKLNRQANQENVSF